jgi:hypothetical protein
MVKLAGRTLVVILNLYRLILSWCVGVASEAVKDHCPLTVIAVTSSRIELRVRSVHDSHGYDISPASLLHALSDSRRSDLARTRSKRPRLDVWTFATIFLILRHGYAQNCHLPYHP